MSEKNLNRCQVCGRPAWERGPGGFCYEHCPVDWPDKRQALDKQAEKRRAKKKAYDEGVRAGEIVPAPRGERGPARYGSAKTATKKSEAVEPESISIMEGLDIRKADDRFTALERVARQLDSGTLQPSSAAQINMALKLASVEKPADENEGGVTVRFVEIRSREDADAFRRGDYGPTSAAELN